MIVGGNELTGEVPSQFGLLISLEELALEDNDLIGSIPTELGSTGLKLIELSNNKLTGPIPTELGLLTTLEDIIVGKLISFDSYLSKSARISDKKLINE